jgi:hypothetical protein
VILDHADIETVMLEGPMETGSFDEAFNHYDLNSRPEWRISIGKEFRERNFCAVWKKINEFETTPGY